MGLLERPRRQAYRSFVPATYPWSVLTCAVAARLLSLHSAAVQQHVRVLTVSMHFGSGVRDVGGAQLVLPAALYAMPMMGGFGAGHSVGGREPSRNIAVLYVLDRSVGR
jgi:hypothetical protein